jgi:aryl-alcohol dehydrogenase-like predicted oxidoreductase
MRYRRLGRTGLIVSELCLGTNTFGGSGPVWSAIGALDQSQANAVMKAALEAGINFIDTADMYAGGESEQRIGKAMRDLGVARSEVVIMTKTGGRTGAGPNAMGLSRVHVLAAVEDSLQRLGTDHLDIYLLHFPDPATRLEETLRALDDLVRAGKVRYIGVSNYRAWEAMKGIGISEREGLARFEVLETHWSVATREAERELVPMVIDCGMGLLVWGPLLGGLLTGKFARDGTGAGTGRTGGKVPPTIDRSKLFDTIDVLTAVARRHGVKVPQVALAWLLHKPAVSSVLFGVREASHVADNIGAINVRLTAEDLAVLDAVAAPAPVHDGVTQVGMSMADRLPFVR